MKKEGLILILLLILPLASAIELTYDETLNQGQTLILKISGNFVEPIQDDNIYFYRQHVAVPFNYDFMKLGEDYYLYATTSGKTVDNYSIIIKDAEYYVLGGTTSDDDIVVNFSIVEGYADFSVSPGYILTDDDFSIDVQNIQDISIEIQIQTEKEESSGSFFSMIFGVNQGESTSLTLGAGEIESIDFGLENLTNATLNTIYLSTENTEYEIPVYVILAGEEEAIEPNPSFKFESQEVNITLATNSSTTRTVYILNNGNSDLENISLKLTGDLIDYIYLDSLTIDDLGFNDSEKITLNIISGEVEGTFSGRLEARNYNLTLYDSMNITINLLKDYIPLDNTTTEENGTTTTTSQTCEELEGVICETGQRCSKEQLNAKDGVCCMGECTNKTTSSKGKLVGWTIIIFLFLLAVWFYRVKYRRQRRAVNLMRYSGTRRGLGRRF